MAILISDKVDFKGKNITSDREDHFIMRKEPIHHIVRTILHVDARG